MKEQNPNRQTRTRSSSGVFIFIHADPISAHGEEQGNIGSFVTACRSHRDEVCGTGEDGEDVGEIHRTWLEFWHPFGVPEFSRGEGNDICLYEQNIITNRICQAIEHDWTGDSNQESRYTPGLFDTRYIDHCKQEDQRRPMNFRYLSSIINSQCEGTIKYVAYFGHAGDSQTVGCSDNARWGGLFFGHESRQNTNLMNRRTAQGENIPFDQSHHIGDVPVGVLDRSRFRDDAKFFIFGCRGAFAPLRQGSPTERQDGSRSIAYQLAEHLRIPVYGFSSSGVFTRDPELGHLKRYTLYSERDTPSGRSDKMWLVPAFMRESSGVRWVVPSTIGRHLRDTYRGQTIYTFVEVNHHPTQTPSSPPTSRQDT